MQHNKTALAVHAGDASSVTLRIPSTDEHITLFTTENYSDDTRKMWLVLELWALQHNVTEIIDYESDPIRWKPDAHKIMTELRREILGTA